MAANLHFCVTSIMHRCFGVLADTEETLFSYLFTILMMVHISYLYVLYIMLLVKLLDCFVAVSQSLVGV
uniref:Uncharacterized protein n=1 Tax=Populus trichocarpa TaxID=3694 RepID=A9PD10_POPTR|nr:unknown [Populus trichocarpa]